MSEDTNMPSPDDNPPNKPVKSKKKPTIKKVKIEPEPIIPDIDVALSPEIAKSVNEMLMSALKQYDSVISEEERLYRDDIECLLPQLTEFLDDFLLIGHTPTGKRVILKYAPSQRTFDSLEYLIREFIIQEISRRSSED